MKAFLDTDLNPQPPYKAGTLCSERYLADTI